ncbi:CTLH/CRA C-terminal to lish motif domain-containing protein [Armillaria nabsnona]|nr:CTLH/CRA C-terminal to lish motif domain-containing protein [Armillaria nabsnona]
MEAALKELTKLEKLTGDSSAKAKSASIFDSLDSLLDSLRAARQLCVEDVLPQNACVDLSRTVEARKKDIDERQKEIYSSMSRLGKALEKKFTGTLPSYPNLFTSEQSVAALERTVVLHFLRTGQFDTAQTLLEESNTDIPSALREQFIDLHRILQALKDQDTGPALQYGFKWARENRDFLKSRASPLEFYLHRSQYVRLLLSSHPPDPRAALAYANSSMRMFYDHHEDEFKRLMACLAFMPLSRLKTSPYADLASPSLHWDLEPLFAKEYCASLGMSKQVPLKVVTEIGGGGALAKIEKGKRVMRERKSEWSQTDELPIEIPVPSENRYHSIFTLPELTGLSQEDVDLLDAIIDRAGASATAFLTVFKAYSDILQERGLDPHEVVYYGKLLKLGTLKGGSWADKWGMVKDQHGYGQKSKPMAAHTGSSQPTRQRPPPERAIIRSKPPPRDDDSFTLHSHDTESEQDETAEESAIDAVYHHPVLIRARAQRQQSPPPPPSDVTANSLGLDFGMPPSTSPPPSHVMPPPRQRRQRLLSLFGSSESDIAGDNMITPPAYNATGNDHLIHRQHHQSPLSRNRPKPQCATPVPYRKPTLPPVKASVISKEDDVWKKIDMLRDEQEADAFRQLRLIERYWEVWKQGFQWIMTTNNQIQDARDNLVMRRTLQVWSSRLDAYRRTCQTANAMADKRQMKKAFFRWRRSLVAKQNENWRNSMRSKMKIVRTKREQRVRKDAWAKWRQSYRSHLSDQHYKERLSLRIFKRWKAKLSAVDGLEDVADEVQHARAEHAVERYWTRWRQMTHLRAAESVIAQQVGQRVKRQVMKTWRKQMNDLYSAEEYRNLVVIKSAMRRWKAAQLSIHHMESRADKHLARQDDVLLRAVTRVWKARERGHLLESARAAQLVKSTWSAWKQQLREQRARNEIASTFYAQSTLTARKTFQTWRQVLSTHQNSHLFAVQYHSSHLRSRMLLIWRMRWHKQLKMMKKSRLTDNFVVTRRVWNAMRAKYRDKQREHQLQAFKVQKLRKLFIVWVERARRHKECTLFQTTIQHRILRSALTQWTNRVIDVKLQELEVTQRHEVGILHTERAAFSKWKRICIRHVEDLSLMESYRDVKREDNVRRIFHQWLAAARAARHRRLLLQRREDEVKLATMEMAWDKWRDKFKDDQLRPIEYELLIRNQQNALRHVLDAWKAKTKSLPAIGFHASHIKAKCWKIWTSQMPRAKLARKAREVDRKNTLTRFLDNWVQAHRTKLARKAVARARQLRLPTASSTPRRPTVSRPEGAPSQPFRNRTGNLARQGQLRCEGAYFLPNRDQK